MLQIKRTMIGEMFVFVICLQIAIATNGHCYIVFKYYVMYGTDVHTTVIKLTYCRFVYLSN